VVWPDIRIQAWWRGQQLKSPSDRKGGADRVETDVIMIRLGEAAVGDVLVKDAEIDR
jgi:hypothetical protein